MSPVYPAPHQRALGETISYVLQCRSPIYNELTSNTVNPGPLGETTRRVKNFKCLSTPSVKNALWTSRGLRTHVWISRGFHAAYLDFARLNWITLDYLDFKSWRYGLNLAQVREEVPRCLPMPQWIWYCMEMWECLLLGCV